MRGLRIGIILMLSAALLVGCAESPGAGVLDKTAAAFDAGSIGAVICKGDNDPRIFYSDDPYYYTVAISGSQHIQDFEARLVEMGFTPDTENSGPDDYRLLEPSTEPGSYLRVTEAYVRSVKKGEQTRLDMHDDCSIPATGLTYVAFRDLTPPPER